jgi:protein tyrosine phosphatase
MEIPSSPLSSPSAPPPPESHQSSPSKIAAFTAAFFEGIGRLFHVSKKKETVMNPTELWIDLLTKTNHFYERHRTEDPFCVERTAFQEIKANKVGETTSKKFAFVASHLPSYYEFSSLWKELFNTPYAAIIDLTTSRDVMPGAVMYYPVEQAKIDSIDVAFKNASEDNTFAYHIKTAEGEKTILRFHFNRWFDHSAVNVETLLFLTETIEQKFHPSKERPLWIHCMAGIGRTGTLVTAFILKEKIQSKEINRENLGPSLVNLIFELRKERSPYFVETFDQFALLLSFGETFLNLLGPA